MPGLALAAALGSAHADLLTNGSFEEAVVAPGSTWQRFNGTDLIGWTTYSTHAGTVEFTHLFAPVTDGVQAVELERPGDSISQSFATIIGQLYRVSFDQSAFGGGYGWFSTVLVTAGDASATFGGIYTQYEGHTLDFVAHESLSTLKFENAGRFGTYPHLDHVSVAAVPEPGTWALAAVGLALLGFARRRAPRVAST